MKIQEIAEKMGSKATSLARLASLEVESVVARTRQDLLEVARWLELQGASKMPKAKLAAGILDALRARVRLRAPKEKPAPKAKAPAKVAAGKAKGAAKGAKKEPVGKAGPPEKAPAPAKAPAPGKGAPGKAVAAGKGVVASKAGAARKVAPEPAPAGEDPGATAKLDIGPAGKAEKAVAQIPWSYGQDRVVAAAVDPDRLFVQWEVTDQAIEKARAALGPSGRDCWLDIRVHDTTDVLFDGTNAHAVMDQGVDRSARQWFFEIGKPTSSAHVEVGLLARDGRFARIARSRRVVFPRKQSAPWRDPEWLTVLPGTREVRHAGAGLPGHAASPPPAPEAAARSEAPPPPFEPIALWRLHESGADREARIAELLAAGWERVEWSEVEGEGWTELLGRAEWMEPVVRSSWKAGPFTHPVEVEPPRREEWSGPAVRFRVGGVTHVVYGPWQVIIRNLGAFREHAEVGRWEIYRSWVAEAGHEVRGTPATGAPPGASENVGGGSELAWKRGSELRLGGASERWRLGASELRLGGASELAAAGGSERRLGGASERVLGGASEWRLGGASERVREGAARAARPGGSEGRLGGASERSGAASASPYPRVED